MDSAVDSDHSEEEQTFELSSESNEPDAESSGDEEGEAQEEVIEEANNGGLEERMNKMESNIAELKELVRDQMSMMRSWRAKEGVKPREKFKAPREHPKFDGKRESLEDFIMDMQMRHSDYTTGVSSTKHNPGFILQLGSYFEGNAKTWFRLYATRRTKANHTLSWEKLTRDLRRDYGGKHEAETRFTDYFALKQKGDVNSYISEKTAAALLAEDDLTERAKLYGFLSGLKADVQDYVRLQCPKDIREAEDHARAYENNLKNRKRKSETKPTETKGSPSGEPKKFKDLSLEQKKALEELRSLRRNRCFGCGIVGHRRDECKANEETLSKHRTRIESLRAKIRGESKSIE